MHEPLLTTEELERLRAIPTPAVANALETFGIRLRTEGFMRPGIHQMFPALPPVIGYAVTARVVCGQPAGSERTAPLAEYWRHLEARHRSHGPLVAVVQDLDSPPFGAWIGEVNSNIHKALGCVGLVTDGGVRDLDEVEALGFPLWAGAVSVSHGYAHLVDFDLPVRVGGLVVAPGELLLADRHGVIEIPLQVAREVPAAAGRVETRERRVISYCQSSGFTAEGLAALTAELADHH